MFKLKKAVSVGTAAIAAAAVLSVSAFAYTGQGTVSVRTSLNVRQSGSTSAAIIGRLYDNSKVTILGSQNGWYKISYNGATGWVSGSYIDTENSRSSVVVNTAEDEVGVKYVFGGASPASGFDCSGLTMYSYNKAGISLPHSSFQQSLMGTAVTWANLQPGDLVFFDTNGNGSINHVGIYIGGGSFVNAQSGGGMVKIANLNTNYWASRYVTARRIIQ